MTFKSPISFSLGQCSLGVALYAVDDSGICAILLGDEPDALVTDLASRFPRRVLERADDSLCDELHKVLAHIDQPNSAQALPRPLAPGGTAFQQEVWQALQAIPCGSTLSYGELASRVGRPNAVRAVAGACASNPLAVVVPCHRILRSDGGLSGYRWGIDRKRQLLERERVVGRV